MAERDFKYELYEQNVISESETSNWNVEFNLICFGKNPTEEKAKYDLRKWNREGENAQMSKGISLTIEQWTALADLLIEKGLFTKH